MLSVKVLLFLVVSMACAFAVEESRAPLEETQSVGSACPLSDYIPDSELAEVTESETEEENKIDIQAWGNNVTLPNFGQQILELCAEPDPSMALQEANVCPKDRVVTASPEEKPVSRKRRKASSFKNCDACPTQQRFLRRHGKCFVLFWSLQQVRTVVCPQRPWRNQICNCGTWLLYRSICMKAHWIRVWFWSWCPISSNLPWGYHKGLNYNFRWLPQDCQCRCFRKSKC